MCESSQNTVQLTVGCQEPEGRRLYSAPWNVQSFSVWLIGKKRPCFCSFKMINHWPAYTVGQYALIYCFSSWLGQYEVLFNYRSVYPGTVACTSSYWGILLELLCQSQYYNSEHPLANLWCNFQSDDIISFAFHFQIRHALHISILANKNT